MAKSPKSPFTPLRADQFPEWGISMRQELLIGRVIVSWSRLEAVMQDTLWSLLGVNIEDGKVLTGRADATRKLQWLRTFAIRYLAGEELKSLQEVLKRIEDRQEDRNFIAHGSWFTMQPDAVPMCSSVRAKDAPSGEIVAESFPDWRMLEIISDIAKANEALTAWREAHEEKTKASTS